MRRYGGRDRDKGGIKREGVGEKNTASQAPSEPVFSQPWVAGLMEYGKTVLEDDDAPLHLLGGGGGMSGSVLCTDTLLVAHSRDLGLVGASAVDLEA